MNVTVESSTLRTIGYDESLALLRLEFQSRAVYDYFEVPVAVFESLLGASSAGACFNAMVRGCFQYERVFPLAADHGQGGER
jgi:hypothetical protein